MPYSREEKEQTNNEIDSLIKETDLDVVKVKLHGPSFLSKIVTVIKKIKAL